MPCPNSPEPDGYHRYVLPSTGAHLAATCQYCGQPKTYRPFADAGSQWTTMGERTAAAASAEASHAARRAKREAAE